MEYLATCAIARGKVQVGGALKLSAPCLPYSEPEKIVLHFRFGQAFSHDLGRQQTLI